MRSLLLLPLLLSCAARDPSTQKPDSGSATALAIAPSTTAPSTTAPSASAVRFDTPRGTWVIRVEIVRTASERARGLMFRRELAKDTGMLFLFEEEEEHSFWMRNTLLSLDMIFLAGDRSVAGIVANATPRTDTGRSVGKPSRYVLEVAGGEAYAHGLAPGARAVFVGIDE